MKMNLPGVSLPPVLGRQQPSLPHMNRPRPRARYARESGVVSGLRHSMTIDFSRWAVAAPKDTSGIGREARDVRAVLGVRHQFVCQSMNFVTEPASGPLEI